MHCVHSEPLHPVTVAIRCSAICLSLHLPMCSCMMYMKMKWFVIKPTEWVEYNVLVENAASWCLGGQSSSIHMSDRIGERYSLVCGASAVASRSRHESRKIHFLLSQLRLNMSRRCLNSHSDSLAMPGLLLLCSFYSMHVSLYSIHLSSKPWKGCWGSG